VPQTYGYARVSTDGQTLDVQVAQLRAAGADRVFKETISGARRDRVQLQKLLDRLEPEDVLLVTRLDLLNILGTVAEKGAAFRSLADTWADTTTSHGRLMLTVLGGLAEFERELIRTRTGEGRARAKAAGKKMGRAFKLTPHQQQEARQRREAGETITAIAKSYAVHHSTISRLCA
jgi:DNA invertase Pin-like site-specific DNA recombinase